MFRSGFIVLLYIAAVATVSLVVQISQVIH